MKRRTRNPISYWPGYVDALVNVVLSLLFVVGLMAAGLMALNVEALGNFLRARPTPGAPVAQGQANPSITRLTVGEPLVLAPSAQEQEFIESRADLGDSPAPPVVLAFDALQYQLSAAHIDTLRQATRAATPDTVWTVLLVMPREARTRRDANTRLGSVREALLDQGVSPLRIVQQTLEQGGSPLSNGRRVYIYGQTPNNSAP